MIGSSCNSPLFQGAAKLREVKGFVSVGCSLLLFQSVVTLIIQMITPRCNLLLFQSAIKHFLNIRVFTSVVTYYYFKALLNISPAAKPFNML